MNLKPLIFKKNTRLLILMLCLLPAISYASGFQLFEESAAGVGDFHSGASAEGNDASIAWYNPAGLVLFNQPTFTLSAVGVNLGLTFDGTVQNNASTRIPGLHHSSHIENLQASNETGSASSDVFITIPAFHLIVPVNDRFFLGLSVVVPFGLETDWPTNSILRYSATDTQLTDIDITPSFAFKINQQFSIGAGIDINHVSATFDQVVGLGELKPYNTDSLSENTASEWLPSWHAGLLYQFTPQTRLGLTYHSGLKVNATGTSTLTGPLVQLATNNGSDSFSSYDLKSKVNLPAYTTMSIFHQINPTWAIKGSATYTEWEVFKNVPLFNVAGVEQVAASTSFQPVLLDVNVPQNFHNTWLLSTGVNFQQNEKLLWRVGLGFDQDPTNNTDRNARLPDGNIFAIALGLHVAFTKQISIDMGYQHLMTADGNINNTGVVGAQNTTVIGTTDNNGNLFALQLNCTI